ncbi:unnamed protein product [Paramecium pentaurelia]|uniref:Tetratricopeptide repeat protein n=1 Tax=Paramecium pentaurelia TaxID=43138 RepID=A0A8S1XJI5_9CILI|nr:unnamed protein product [Paramecium pentaurelia]
MELLFNVNLYCSLHGLVMDAFCKNPECNIEDRICCNTCVQEKHKHQTTRIWELKNVFEDAIKLLSDRDKKLLNFIDQITQKVSAIRQITNKDITYLKQMVEDSENQTLTNLINALRISYSLKNHEISERVTELVEKQLNKSSLISFKSINYVKLLEENKKDEAKQVLQEIIDLDQNNEIYKQEMNRINSQQLQNSSSQNVQQNAVDINHLILQYQTFLQEDQNEKEALKVLDKILEIDVDNYIYQKERLRLTHEIDEYSNADDCFFYGQYLASAYQCDKLLEIRPDPRIFYQKSKQQILFQVSHYFTQRTIKMLQILLKNLQNLIQKTSCQLLFAKKDQEALKLEANELKKCFDSINLTIEGQILILQNNYENAKECFEQAFSLDYFNYEAHFLQALCLSKTLLSQTQELSLSPQEILQNKNKNGILDMKKIKKFYCMYMEGYNQQNNNQIQFIPENQLEWNQIVIQSKNKQPTNTKALQQ